MGSINSNLARTISLSSARLLIQDLSWDTLEFIHRLHSMPEVQEYATLDIPKSISESKNYLEKYINQQANWPRSEYGFCILFDQKPVGLIGLSDSLNKFRSAELWFKLSPEYWGKGFTTEAASILLEFGFKEILLHRIEAGTATENLASIKVLEKIGMKREGIRRKILPIRGEWKDNFHYAILDEDFSQNLRNPTG
jgi:ribosomal-protein-alanine N-acetyltransferase